MIHAYPEIYLNRAQAALGDAFHYAVNACHIEGAAFVNLFLVSSISKRLENGEPVYLVGKSGIEIACDIMDETMACSVHEEASVYYTRSCEYWIGWAIAYYQWYSCRSYSRIFEAVSYEDLVMMYRPLHEADISKFVDVMEEKLLRHFPDTNLKRIRTICRLSQSALASRSGVGLRSIQMYEQRKKNINHASADTLYRLSKILGCKMEDLLEPQGIE